MNASRLAVLVMLGAGLIGCGPRPCKDSSQCEEGQVCVVAEGEDVGVCQIGPSEGEGEGEGEGDGGPVLVTRVDVGIGFGCVLDAAARVQCWGTNFSGQLGRVTEGSSDPLPAAVEGLSDVEVLAVAQRHSCAIGLKEGIRTVVCWGDGTEGSLGQIGQLDEILVEPALEPSVLRTAVDVDADGDNNGGVTCVVDDIGRVFCFGPRMPGYDPALGIPVEVPSLTGATELFVTIAGLCARVGGDVVCTHLSSAAASTLGCLDDEPCDLLTGAEDFSLDTSNVCIVDGTDVFCAGDNDFGVARPGSPTDTTESLGVLATSATHVRVGVQHACAIAPDGVVSCWGRSLSLSTGRPENDTDLFNCGDHVPGTRCQDVLPVPGVAEPLRFSDLETRNTQTCARESNGEGVVCWGDDVAPARLTFTR